MKSSKGLTIAELVVVLAIIGIFISILMAPMVGWLSQYRFEAAGRAFINAAHAVRMQAISGLPVLRVRQAPLVGIKGTNGQKTFTVYLDTVTFTCDTCGSPPTKDELPIKVGDYVGPTGFNQPDYISGNLFKVTAISPATPTVTAATPDKDAFNHKQWKVTGLSFDCESCADDDTSKCIQWTDSASASYSLTTGKVQVAACLKFIANTELAANQRVPYSVTRNKTGSTVECYYDPKDYDIKVSVRKSGATTYDALGTPTIVFDFAGATKSHADYLVTISKMKKGSIDPKGLALNFHIDPSGRIKIGE